MPTVTITDEQFQKLLDVDAENRKSDFEYMDKRQSLRDERDCQRTDAMLREMRMVSEFRDFERSTRKVAVVLQALETVAIIVIAAILYVRG